MGSFAQYLEVNPIYNITKKFGDDLFPSWSEDGTKLVFQSNRNGNWDIYQFNLKTDTIVQLTNTSANEKIPIMLNKRNQLAYTSDVSGEDQVYFFNFSTSTEKPIFEREINSKAASFPASEYLLYSLGFDKLSKEWGLYRYEFKYPSLKYIFPLKTDKFLPKVSSDAEYILLVTENDEKSIDQLNIINWYGNVINEFIDYNFIDPSWYPGGLKIMFISDMDNKKGELYTIWKDGSHLERLTNDTLSMKNPVVSPTAKYMAVSVLLEEGYDIFVIPLEDY